MIINDIGADFFSLGIVFIQSLAFGGGLIFVILVLSFFVYGLSSRLSSLESQLNRLSVDEHISSRVAFIEYFVSNMHKNLTGKVFSCFIII